MVKDVAALRGDNNTNVAVPSLLDAGMTRENSNIKPEPEPVSQLDVCRVNVVTKAVPLFGLTNRTPFVGGPFTSTGEVWAVLVWPSISVTVRANTYCCPIANTDIPLVFKTKFDAVVIPLDATLDKVISGWPITCCVGTTHEFVIKFHFDLRLPHSLSLSLSL